MRKRANGSGVPRVHAPQRTGRGRLRLETLERRLLLSGSVQTDSQDSASVVLDATYSQNRVYQALSSPGVPDEWEPDDSAAQAGQLLYGTPQQHSLHVVGDDDWAFFDLGAVSDVDVETSGTAGDTVIWLLDQGLNKVCFDDDGGSEHFSRITATLPPGRYYVHVTGYDDAVVADYLLTLNYRPIAASPDNHEPDDSPETASTLPWDVSQSRSIAPVDDQDWLVLTMQTDSRVTLDLDSVSPLDVQLYDAALEPLSFDQQQTSGGDTTAGVDLSAGTYYLRIEHTAGPFELPEYTVTAHRVPLPPPPDPALGTRVLYEDWEAGAIDPDRWTLFDYPLPKVEQGLGFDGSMGFNPNGDGSYASGAYSVDTYDLQDGLRLRWKMRVPYASELEAHHYAFVSVTTGEFYDWHQPGVPSEQSNVSLIYMEATDSRRIWNFSFATSTTRLPYPGDAWVECEIVVHQDGYVSLRADGEVKAVSPEPLDLSAYPDSRVQLAGRARAALEGDPYMKPIIDDIEVYTDVDEPVPDWPPVRQGDGDPPPIQREITGSVDGMLIPAFSGGGDRTQPFLTDIDGDDDLDLLMVQSRQPRLFLNTGTQTAPNWSVGQVDWIDVGDDLDYMTLADIDADGDADGFITERGRLNFYRNTGSPFEPDFELETENLIPLEESYVFHNTRFADIDADGDLDMVAAELLNLWTVPRISIYRNDGTAQSPDWQLHERLTPDDKMVDYDQVRVDLADVDSDGDLDILCGFSLSTDYMWLIENVGSAQQAQWSNAQPWAYVGDMKHVSPTSGDLDGDGSLELLLGSASGRLALYEESAQEPGQWQQRVYSYVAQDVGNDAAPSVADFDGDGDLDLLVGTSSGGLLWYENAGHPLAPRWRSPLDLSGHFAFDDSVAGLAPAAGDIDRDGDQDIVVGDLSGDLHVCWNDGTIGAPVWGRVSHNYLGLGTASRAVPVLADMDADGDLDLLLGGGDGTVALYENTAIAGPAQWALANRRLGGLDVGSAAHPTVADMDGDHDLDILVGNLSGRVAQIENTGTSEEPLFTTAGYDLFPEATEILAAPAAGDMDDDGDPDLFMGSVDGAITFFRNHDPKLAVTPRATTVVAGAELALHVDAPPPNAELRWSVVRAGSNGAAVVADAAHAAIYTAGTVDAPGFYDVLEVRDVSRPDGLSARVHVNVIRPEDQARVGKAIIVAGRREGDPVWHATNQMANFAWRTLGSLGFSRESILYLSPDPEQDVDGDGLPDPAGAATLQNVQTAFQEWAADAEELTVYFVDHGVRNGKPTVGFRLNPEEVLFADTLDDWLDDWQTDGQTATVVIDTCYAGAFLPELAGPGRTMIAGAAADEHSYFIAGGQISFSNAFFGALQVGHDVLDAFHVGADAMSGYQSAQLDDNGDGLYQPTVDGARAAHAHIGFSYVGGWDRPTIDEVSPRQVISSGTEATIWVSDVSSANPIETVWAVVIPPSFVPDPDNIGDPIADLPRIELAYNVAAERWEGSYAGFTEPGTYAITAYASDIYSASLPKRTYVSQAGFVEKTILVAGEGGLNPDAPPDTTGRIAAYAHRTLLNRWFDEEDIYYLGGAGEPGVDAAPVLAHLEHAVTGWAADADKVNLIFIGEGRPEGFQLNETETLAPATLDALLDTFQSTRTQPVTVVFDASHSAAWIDALTPEPDRERILITSAPADGQALCAAGGRLSFTQLFMNQLFLGRSVGAAFARTVDAVEYALGQWNWHGLDDNGNGVPGEKPGDGELARDTWIGSAFVTGSDLPEIGAVSPDGVLEGETDWPIWAADVSDAEGVARVWAAVVPPDYSPYGAARIRRIELTWNAETERFEAAAFQFDRMGAYTVLVHAEDVEGNLSTPNQLHVVQTADVYEPDDVPEQASIIVPRAEPQSRDFGHVADQDWTRFYGRAGRTYQIAATNLDANADVVLQLYDADTLQEPLISRDGAGAGEDEYLSWSCPDDGIYYLRVTNWNPDLFGEGTRYDLSVNVPDAPQLPGWVSGTVYDAVTGEPVAGAWVVGDLAGSAVTETDGAFLMALEEGTYTLTAGSAAHDTEQIAGVTVLPLDVLEGQDFSLWPLEPTATPVTLDTRQARVLRYTEPDGSLVTLTLTGGSAECRFVGPGLEARQTGRLLTVNGPATLDTIRLTETDDRSVLAVSARGGDGIAQIGGIFSTTPLRVLQAPRTDFTGDGLVFVDAAIDVVRLRTTRNGADLSFGGAADAMVVFAHAFGPETDVNAPGAAIRTLIVDGWQSGALHARSVQTLLVRDGAMGADVVLSDPGQSMSRAVVRGVLSGTWAVEGDVGVLLADELHADWDAEVAGRIRMIRAQTGSGRLTASALDRFDAADVAGLHMRLTAPNPTVRPMSVFNVRGEFADSDIRTAAGIQSVLAGSMSNVTLFAGVNDAVTALPVSPADFAREEAALGRVLVRGATGRPATENVCIAAHRIDYVHLADLRMDNAGDPFGVAAQAPVRLLRYNSPGESFTALRNAAASSRDEDFHVNLL